MSRPKSPNAMTDAERQALAAFRLKANGGKRLGVKLGKQQINKINKLIEQGYAKNQQAVILRLIDEARDD